MFVEGRPGVTQLQTRALFAPPSDIFMAKWHRGVSRLQMWLGVIERRTSFFFTEFNVSSPNAPIL
jgi:hypothetical protein